ncbi:MAG: hypothetical protein WC310_04165 [Patescibacteria group bacterium]|jgi:hypothetical protein
MTITFNSVDYIVMIIIAAAIIVGLVFWFVKKSHPAPIDDFSAKKISEEWLQIEELIKQDSPNAWKLAVLEADKLVDYALKTLAVPGKDFGERIRAINYQLPSIRNVWPAHIVRNKLVHESDYQLDKKTAVRSVQQFKEALKTLKVLK